MFEGQTTAFHSPEDNDPVYENNNYRDARVLEQMCKSYLNSVYRSDLNTRVRFNYIS